MDKLAIQKAVESVLAPTPAASPVTYREFSDVEAMRRAVFGNVVSAVQSRYPLENSRFKLALTDLQYQDEKPITLEDQKRAIMRGHPLDRKLHGTWQLIDKSSGKTVDSKKSVVAHVPYITERGTVIYNGNEYTIANQMRLKPGVYARQKENGILESHFNTKIGTGPSFRLYMEPDTGIFRLGVGQSTLKLYPILRSMGVSDKEIETTWGRDLLQKNIEAEDPRAVSRAFMKLVNTRGEQEGQAAETAATAGIGAEVAEKAAAALQRLGYYESLEEIEGDMQEEGCVPKRAFEVMNLAPAITELAEQGMIRLSRKALKSKAKSSLQAALKPPTVLSSKEEEKEPEGQEKEAKIGARESDRRWTQLWFTGTIRASESRDRPFVCLEVHRGLCEAAYHSLRSEGVECEGKFDEPHITLLQGQEAADFKKKHGIAWKGVAKDGQKMRFKLDKIVSCVPHGWTDKYDRVWFIECESPDLRQYRKDLRLTGVPVNSDGNEQRFHITFAVHRNTVKQAAELFCEDRAYAWDRLLDKQAAEGDHGTRLREVFDKMELDPEVTEVTLGQRFNNVGTAALLRASQKLLNINSGKEDVDDRDSLAFQTIHSPEDFFAERVTKDAGQLGRKLLWKATLRGNLKHIPSGALSPQLRSVLLNSGMGQPLEEVNPFEIFDQHMRVLRLGEGGIPSIDAVPDEARNVQPSHFGFVDPIRAPESEKIGVDARVSHRTIKGSDGQLYTWLINARTGKEELVSASKASKSVLAFPGEMSKGKNLRAMVKSKQIEYVKPGDVDYVLPDANQMFTASSNLVPMVSGIKGGRLLMGAKMVTQALPIRDAEAPLVQNLATGDRSFDELYGRHVGAIFAKGRGVVTAIDKTGITVRYMDGTVKHEMYNNFPFNRKTFAHNTPAVKAGDQVSEGSLLAKSNFTDNNGVMAVGTNLRAAYMTFKGLNHKDAIVVSESAAQKLSSEHMYQNTVEGSNELDIGRKQFVSIFPSKYGPTQLKTVDDKGVVKVGTKVKYGDPLILALNKTKIDAIHHGHKPMFTDGSVTWDHEFEGEVTDVDQTKDGGFNVTVKAYAPVQEGDKLAGRYGDKGVVAKVVPDAQMPHDKDGTPLDILLTPVGIISRVNPSQVFEALLGKVAKKNGKALKIPGFMQGSLLDYVEKQLRDAKLSDTEDLTDPDSGRRIPKVLTGYRFFMKLHHTAESKGGGRDIGAYTSEGLPARGGEFGSKRVSSMETNALLSHGALNVIRDAHIVRGQRNDEYWKSFRMGLTPPSPKVPMIYNKFLAYLRGAGINVKKDGNRLQLFALTDKDVGQLSSGPIKSSETVSGDKLKPVPGGLFDEGLTGGHGGNRWSHVELAEPMPNPVMEEPIRRLLGLTQKKFEAILGGQESINGLTGGAGISKALSKINIDDAIRNSEGILKEGPRSKRDDAAKVLGYLKTMKRHNMRPEDWVVSKVPVLPPSFRPITVFRTMQMSADPNYLYRDLILANDDLREMRPVVHDTQLGSERLQVYNAFKAVTGLGDPVQPKTVEKGVRGLLAHVFGHSPKFGMFQRRVIGSAVDVVGRAVITPNPDLSMDQVGLPENKAWTIYRPFIVRRLIRRGMPATEAAKAVANQTDVGRKALLEEVDERPVIINRAPTLHRYGFMAAWPVLVKGSTLQVPPSILDGFNADFDGDAMNYHVPVDDAAVKDAVEKMMPSKNLKSVRSFGVHYLPEEEFMMGAYLASANKSKAQPRVFKSRKDVIAAYQRGDIGVNDPVVVHA